MVLLLSRVTQSNRTPRQSHKLVLDPNQTSFGFALPQDANAPVPCRVVPVAERPVKAIQKPEAKPPARPRPGPARARISFEGPVRLKRNLERIARDLDRSKTTLLREALESFLRKHEEAEQ